VKLVASSSGKDAIIAWEGDSKEVLTSFPDAVKRNLGFDLHLLQQGEQPTDFRPMTSMGPGSF
jgi:phage-related protein